MYQCNLLHPPFFELGPKAYMYGSRLLKLALEADIISQKYHVPIIFTPQYTDIPIVAAHTSSLIVCAQHMDPITIGRGLGSVLPEALKSAGAKAVMLNHAEKTISLDTLARTIDRANEVGIMSIACANTFEDMKNIAHLAPNVIIAEPTDLIGTGKISGMEYIAESINCIKSINSNILVLQGAGVSTPRDVYNIIYAGAEATGCTSGVMKSSNPEQTLTAMISAVREAWNTKKEF